LQDDFHIAFHLGLPFKYGFVKASTSVHHNKKVEEHRGDASSSWKQIRCSLQRLWVYYVTLCSVSTNKTVTGN